MVDNEHFLLKFMPGLPQLGRGNYIRHIRPDLLFQHAYEAVVTCQSAAERSSSWVKTR